MRVNQKVAASLVGAVVLVAAAVIGLFAFFAQMEQAATVRTQNIEVLRDANALLSELKDAETGQRGFLLTDDSAFLQPYFAVRDSVTGHLRALRLHTLAAGSRERLGTLAPLIDGKLAELSGVLAMRQANDAAGAVARVRQGRGKVLMDSIRVEIGALIGLESAERERQSALYDAGARRLLSLLVAASLAALFLAGLLVYLIREQAQQVTRNLVHVETRKLLATQELMNARLEAANHAMAISEERMAVTLRSIGDAVMTTDADGRVVLLNTVAETLTGWTTAEASGRAVGEVFAIVNKETRAPATIPVAAALAHGTVQGLANHTVLRSRDGSERDIADSCAPIRDRDGTVIGAVLVFRDVTAQYGVEQALRDTSALVGAVLDTVADGIITFRADNGNVTTMNPAAERIFGCLATDVIGRDVSLLLPEFDGHTCAHVLGDFAPTGSERSRGVGREVTGRVRNGDEIPLELTVTAMSIGGTPHFTALVRDISERRGVEANQEVLDQRLRDQQFYTRSLIESIIDALMTTDARGIITDVNREMEALTGCTRDELIGAPFQRFFTDPERAGEGIRQALRLRRVTNYELTVHNRNGGETEVSYNASTFYDRDRRLLGVIAAARDITAGKRVERELEHAKVLADSASRTKSEFLASMSHEIRTPMNAIVGIAELLAKTPLTAEQDKYVQIFRRAGDNLLNLVNDILDLSKVEAALLEIEHTGFSLSELAERAIELVAPRAAERGLVLTWVIAPNVPTDLIGDPTRLRQVLLNLLGNAIKFTEAGSVALSITRDVDAAAPGTLRFAVTDTGIGIPEPALERVFERFTQADSSTTRQFGGSGLGLTVSKRLVEAMHGRIWVESVAGTGSTFSFALPFEAWVGALSREAAPAVSAAMPLPDLRILLVEDSSDNAVITVAYLQDTPHRVDIAVNGAVACDMFATGVYDLVLMDWQMPVMDGQTATRRMRAWEAATGRPPAPIIALTASALKGDREKCLDAGCTGFLTKPIKQAVLLAAIAGRRVADPRSSAIDAGSVPRPVRLSPKLAARVPLFLSNRRDDVIAMRDALVRGDFPTVQRLGHNMRGTGSGYGFQAVTDFGTAIETEARSMDLVASSRSVDALAAFLDRVGPDGTSAA